MFKKLKILSIILGFSFLGIIGIDLFGSNVTNGMILNNLIPTTYAQDCLEGGCPPCGPLVSNQSGTRYCCAETNSDACDSVSC